MMKSEYDIFTCLSSRWHSNPPLVVIVNGWWIELIPNMENKYVPLINKHIKLMLCVLFCLNRTLIAFGIIALFFHSRNVFPCYYLLRSNKIQAKARISIPITIQLIVPAGFDYNSLFANIDFFLSSIKKALVFVLLYIKSFAFETRDLVLVLRLIWWTRNGNSKNHFTQRLNEKFTSENIYESGGYNFNLDEQ